MFLRSLLLLLLFHLHSLFRVICFSLKMKHAYGREILALMVTSVAGRRLGVIVSQAIVMIYAAQRWERFAVGLVRGVAVGSHAMPTGGAQIQISNVKSWERHVTPLLNRAAVISIVGYIVITRNASYKMKVLLDLRLKSSQHVLFHLTISSGVVLFHLIISIFFYTFSSTYLSHLAYVGCQFHEDLICITTPPTLHSSHLSYHMHPSYAHHISSLVLRYTFHAIDSLLLY